MSDEMKTCPDCGAGVGDLHQLNCDVERCPACGGQALSCACPCDLVNDDRAVMVDGKTYPRFLWTGIWPGVRECEEFGWYCRWVDGGGWVECEKDHPDARANLNRLCTDAIWNADAGRFVMPAAAT